MAQNSITTFYWNDYNKVYEMFCTGITRPALCRKNIIKWFTQSFDSVMIS